MLRGTGMNYIWELAIRAEQAGIPQDKLKFRLAKSYSPYMELSNENINFRDVEPEVEVNPYYRFHEIFKDLFHPDNHEYEELRQVLFDLVIHFLTWLDRRQGMNKRDFYYRFILNDLKNGIFGPEIRDKLRFFIPSEQQILAENIFLLYTTGEMIGLLKDTIQRIFKGAIIYANYEKQDELLFYLDYEENETNKAKLDVIQQLFLPIKFRTEVYWTYHFGIIDRYETMRVDQIALY